METSLDPSALRLPPAAAPPIVEAAWSPVHTVYGGAQRFTHDVVARVGRHALALLDTLAPSLDALRALPFGLDPMPDDAALERVLAALRAKLTREPVEDYRVDFEDGFGPRSDADEDAAAVAAATALARAHREG
ncbi:MAG: HpcH/HpaI aldolase, partial [Myxococcaceae bacterium]|nr:HpcH/HpaI aldolase [Myxococcaceae bacterium]